jgi:membrane dipeptidase
MRPIIDAHLDLSWNALSHNRDQTETIAQIRSRERGMDDIQGRALATVSLPEMRRAGVALCFATVLARANKEAASWKRVDLDFRNQEIARATAIGQLSYYETLREQGHLVNVRTAVELDRFWSGWRPGGTPAYVVSMEGADPMLGPEDVERWWNLGLRIAGLAHYGPSAYAVGTMASGPLSSRAPALLREMERCGMILDTTHLSDPSFFEALKLFGGPVLASHNNCRALVAGERQFTDEQLRLLIGRGAVIGVAMDCWMLTPGWVPGQSPRDLVRLAAAADHIDHICQLVGDCRHAAIGSDLDGGFGTEQSPADLDTIADLSKLGPILSARGYGEADLDAIFYGNWLEFLRRHLP